MLGEQTKMITNSGDKEDWQISLLVLQGIYDTSRPVLKLCI